MMTVRAKLKLTEITEMAWNGPGVRRLKFNCEYDPYLPEDERFSKSTPSGSFEMIVDNPAALEQFNLGGQYYMDFTPADAQSKTV